MAANNDKCLLQDLAERLSSHSDMPKKQAETFLRQFFDLIEEMLNKDSIVKIKGFGTFKLVTVDKRESINVNTGERIAIDEHSKIVFTPDNSLKEYVNRPFSHFQTVVLNEGTDLAEMEAVNVPEDEIIENEVSQEDITAEVDSSAVGIETTTQQALDENPAPIDYTQGSNSEPTVVQHTSIQQEDNSERSKTNSFDITDELSPNCEEESIPQPEPDTEPSEEITAPTAPITHVTPVPESDTSEETSHQVPPTRPINWWKVIALSFIVLLLMLLSYMAGYFRVLCPCDYMPIWKEVKEIPRPASHTPIQVHQIKDTTLTKTMCNDVDTIKEIKSESVPASPVVSQAPSPKPKPHYAQLPDGKYIITGTMRQHIIAKGETLRDIALAAYGSKGYVKYIIIHNKIENPDLVNAGQTINLPLLEKAEK